MWAIFCCFYVYNLVVVADQASLGNPYHAVRAFPPKLLRTISLYSGETMLIESGKLGRCKNHRNFSVSLVWQV